jgi:hypothetical protein
VYLSGCASPVDLSSFAEDEEVKEIIEKGSSATVKLKDGSSPGLKEGNQKITGLDPGKYYMVEEWDDKDNPVSVRDKNDKSVTVQFVSANGQRSTNLADIGLVRNGEITGLTNRYSYRVRSAEPLPGDVPYKALTSPGSTLSAPNTNGAIYLPEPEDDSLLVYTITPSADPSCEAVEIPVSPAGSTLPVRRSNNDIIVLLGQKTVIDYVFYLDARQIFYVLKVASGEDPNKPSEPGDLIITVTLDSAVDNPPQLDTPAISYSQSDDSTVTIMVSNADQYDNNSFFWYIDGVQKGTGISFVLNKSLSEYKIVGVYTITVEASKDGKPYTAAILVTVSS